MEKMKLLVIFMMLLITNSCYGYMRELYILSSIYFYEHTVKKLTQEEKNIYHKENMLSAKLVLIDTEKMPQTHNELKDWVIKKSKTKDYLLMTDVARDVGDIISGGPVPKHIKPIWPFISFTAFNTLPMSLKKYTGLKHQ